MNVSVDGTEYKFANHNDSETEGNWISLDGGEPVKLPSPISFTYNGVNETSFSLDSKDVDIKINVNNYSNHIIKYPFDTHQMYTNTNGKNNVSYEFGGSKYFGNKDAKVFLLESDVNYMIDLFNDFKQGNIVSIGDISSLDKVHSMDTKTLNSNGDTSGEFENLDAGEYSVLIILENEPVILSATAFDVLDYEASINANSYAQMGENYNVNIELKDAPDTEYTYIAGLIRNSAYRTEVKLVSDGSKLGTDLMVNNEYIVDDFDLVDLNIQDMDKEGVKNRIVDVIGPNNVSGKTKTVNSNQTSLNISTDNLPPGYYTLLVEVYKPDNPIVAFGQKDITVTSETNCEIIETIKSAHTNIISGEPIECNFGDGCVGCIECTSNIDLGDTTITIEYLNNQSTNVPTNPDGQLYRNLNIWIGCDDVSDNNIENATVNFKVNKSWLVENNINKSTIELNRFDDGNWQALETTIVDEDENYVYYEAKTLGFSPFAITGQERKEGVGVPATNSILLVSALGIAMVFFLKGRYG